MAEEKDSLAGTLIQAKPKDEVNIGIDTNNTFAENIVQAAIHETLNLSDLEEFLTISQSRETIYKLIDIMSQDSIVASIVESYAEDATESNPDGDVMWVESEDANVTKYISYLLKSLQVNENMYGWVNSLIKYGDVYLRLFKESEYDDDEIFDNKEANVKHRLNEANMLPNEKKETLTEDIILKLQDNEHFVNFVERVPNPAEMFELTRRGKTSGFIKAPYNIYYNNQTVDSFNYNQGMDVFNYKAQKSDVEIYSATNFVHGYLYDDSGRTEEKIDIFDNDNDYENNTNAHSYNVKRGKSMLYDWFKSWREMTLLENSIILTRLTKSSLVRIIQVEVGDMPKEMIANHLQGIKAMMEQKTSVETGVNSSNYTNPGPVENNIYVPVHNGIGNISVAAVGGDYDPKQLTDLEYFRDRFFGGTGVPKQYVGQTSDSTGFNGGTSLTIISAKYAKRVKRIQQAAIAFMTDLINILLFDRKLYSYINNFRLMMQTPTTQEDIDRRDAQANALGVLRDTMDILGDIERKSTRLKIVKSLMQDITSKPEVIEYIQDEIDYVEEQEKENPQEENKGGNEPRGLGGGGSRPSRSSSLNDIGSDLGLEEPENNETPNENSAASAIENELSSETPSENATQGDYLPSFSELGVNSNDVNS